MIVTRTPYRVSFFGGGTDYPAWYRAHGGAVLSTAIDKYCYVACRSLDPAFDYRYRVVHSEIECARAAKDIRHPMVRAVLERAAAAGPLEIHHLGELQTGAGLGTSSAFTVGLLHAIEALAGRRPGPDVLARQAITIEQDVVHEHVGSQDQVAAAYGGLNRIDFHPDDNFRVAPLALPPARLAELQASLLLCFTGFSRRASDIARSTIENLPRHEAELLRMKEMVDEAIAVLRDPAQYLARFGALLDEHWTLKRRLSPQVSTPQIDRLYAEAMAAGATGGKLLGAGGGGTLLLYVEPERQAQVRARLSDYQLAPLRIERTGSRVIPGADAERAGVRVPTA